MRLPDSCTVNAALKGAGFPGSDRTVGGGSMVFDAVFLRRFAPEQEPLAVAWPEYLTSGDRQFLPPSPYRPLLCVLDCPPISGILLVPQGTVVLSGLEPAPRRYLNQDLGRDRRISNRGADTDSRPARNRLTAGPSTSPVWRQEMRSGGVQIGVHAELQIGRCVVLPILVPHLFARLRRADPDPSKILN